MSDLNCLIQLGTALRSTSTCPIMTAVGFLTNASVGAIDISVTCRSSLGSTR